MSRSSLGSIATVYAIRCAELDCSSCDCLYTTDKSQAERTARELGWRLVDGSWLCPCCVPAPKRRARKAVSA
jgi:hypothetical protein